MDKASQTTSTESSDINGLKDGRTINGTHTSGHDRSDAQITARSATQSPPKIETKKSPVEEGEDYDSDISPEEEESIDANDIGFRGKQVKLVQGVKPKPPK